MLARSSAQTCNYPMYDQPLSRNPPKMSRSTHLGKVFAWCILGRRVKIVGELACSAGLARAIGVELAWDVGCA